jgi:ParB-like chromosome segregation protein Spo0J
MPYEKIPVGKLVVDQSFMIRQGLSQDAILRYRDLFREKGSCPALKVQRRTMRVIDGWHRLAAAKEEGLKEVPCEVLDVPDSELRALAYKLNRGHGVPISLEERNKTIVELYTKDGKTQEEIARIVGLSRPRVTQILDSLMTNETNIELSREKQVAIVKLILKGKKQEEIAKAFDVTQGYVSQVKSKWFDAVLKAYEGGDMKLQVAERFGFEASEVDSILQTFGDPLNFKPEKTTLWHTFGIDERFGKRHPGNIPAGLVRNILCRLTKPGDLVLDPFAGGGVVIDVCVDMVNRKCEAFDLTPTREDIKKHDILQGPPPTSRPPDLIFLDPPYGPQNEGDYSDKENDLANMPVEKFCEAMERIFTYWDHGWLVCLMTVYTGRGLGEYVDLPSKMAWGMEKAGWKFADRIVNEIGRAEGTNALTVYRTDRANWWNGPQDLHILIGRKGSK